jgi:hypothetical protein
VTSETSATTAPRPIRARIPFITTSFANNLVYYAALWPLWWLLGVEQILLPFFVLFETARFLIDAAWRVRINMTILFALGLAIWWIVPIIWADRQFLDIFLKETATIWSQFLILVLIWNRVRTEGEWRLVIRALTIIAIYTAAAGMIYVVGLWRGEVVSLVGRVLPQSLVDNSSFFSSIAYRRFGAAAVEVGLLRHRLTALSLSFSSLSMACLLLIPFVTWRGLVARGWQRLFYAAVVLSLVIGLIYTESRISYLALVAGIVLFAVLWLGLLRGQTRLFSLAVVLLGTGAFALLGYIAVEMIVRSLQTAFIDLRPGSWLVRLQIYVVTLQLLPEHPIAGWGVPVRIPGAPSDYSAGTHSSYLGMLFQHGIIGLLFYLAIWASVWRAVIKGLAERGLGRERALFWMALAAAFFGFNIREIADSWWWDQSLTFVIWLMWGAALTAARFVPTRPPATAPGTQPTDQGLLQPNADR